MNSFERVSFLIILFFILIRCKIWCQNVDNLNSVLISTKSGKIQGHILKTTVSQKSYRVFQGIPFAQPPVGNLRFEPPKPINWLKNGTLQTTAYAPDCIQADLISNFGSGSEDCLYLNVYVPLRNQNNDLPVMVWLFGGGFFVGTSSNNTWAPDYLIDRDGVIIVTISYRLGIFGFASTNDLIVPGNMALKDQHLAFKWIKNNIAFFGGNPDKITLFGESSASASIGYHLLSSTSKKLFQGVIMESGSPLCPYALVTAKSIRNSLETIGRVFNVNTTTSESLINGLKNIDALQLLRTAQTTTYLSDINIKVLNKPFTFAPTIEPEHSGAIVTSKAYEAFLRGQFYRVPTMIGVNSQEALVVSGLEIPLRVLIIPVWLNPGLLVPDDMNVNTSQLYSAGREIYKNYFGYFAGITVNDTRIRQFFADFEIVKSVKKQAQLQSKFTPTYFYKFSYVGSSAHSVQGVSHGEEQEYIWRMSNKPISPGDHLTIVKVTTLWTNFAKFGNPTPKPDPILENIIWPLANSSNSVPITYLNIDNPLTISTNFFNADMELWDNLYQKYGNPPFTTY